MLSRWPDPRVRMSVRARPADERTAMTVPDPHAEPRRGPTRRFLARPGRDLGRDRRAHRRRHRVRGVGSGRHAERHHRASVPHDPAARGVRGRGDHRRAPRPAPARLVRAREHGDVGRDAAHRRGHDLAARALLVGRVQQVRAVPADRADPAARAPARAPLHEGLSAPRHDVHQDRRVSSRSPSSSSWRSCSSFR